VPVEELSFSIQYFQREGKRMRFREGEDFGCLEEEV
jgi:hypothetical protein